MKNYKKLIPFLFLALLGLASCSQEASNTDSAVVGTAVTAPGGSCVPTTCEAQAKNCGSISDGCSGTLDCGACMGGPGLCGAGGVANVCGCGAYDPLCLSKIKIDVGGPAGGFGSFDFQQFAYVSEKGGVQNVGSFVFPSAVLTSLTSTTDDKIRYLSTRFSPDGKQIAFDDWKPMAPAGSPKNSITVLKFDPSSTTPVTDWGIIKDGRSPVWTRDGKWFFYIGVKPGTTDQDSIKAMNLTVPDPKPFGIPVFDSSTYEFGRMESLGNFNEGIIISMKSKSDIFPHSQLYYSKNVLSAPLLVTMGGKDVPDNKLNPSYFPKANTLVYEGGDGQLYTCELDLTKATGPQCNNNQQITTKGNNAQPCWTFDGSKILFQSDRDGKQKLYSIDMTKSTHDVSGLLSDDDQSYTSPGCYPLPLK